MINGIKLALAAGLLTAAGIAGWTMNGWRMQSQIDGLVAKHSDALAQANADALAKYAAMERKKQEAINAATIFARQNEKTAAATRIERDRLRDQLAAAESSMSTASITAIRNYSATLSFVLGECAASLEGLAKTADGHATDVGTLINAWPR